METRPQRRQLDRVRRAMGRAVRVDGPARELNGVDLRGVVVGLPEELLTGDSLPHEQLCLVLSGSIQRYAFPLKELLSNMATPSRWRGSFREAPGA